jgi:hypothetical protein
MIAEAANLEATAKRKEVFEKKEKRKKKKNFINMLQNGMHPPKGDRQ